jgi:hypothetical protein
MSGFADGFQLEIIVTAAVELLPYQKLYDYPKLNLDAHPGTARDFELLGNSWQIRQVRTLICADPKENCVYQRPV